MSNDAGACRAKPPSCRDAARRPATTKGQPTPRAAECQDRPSRHHRHSDAKRARSSQEPPHRPRLRPVDPRPPQPGGGRSNRMQIKADEEAERDVAALRRSEAPGA